MQYQKQFAVMYKHAGVVANSIILHIAYSADAVKIILWHWGQDVLTVSSLFC